MTNAEFLIAASLALLPALVLSAIGSVSWQSLLAAVLTCVLPTLWLARKFIRRLGGYTGDCLGAVQQVSEVSCYLAMLAMVH